MTWLRQVWVVVRVALSGPRPAPRRPLTGPPPDVVEAVCAMADAIPTDAARRDVVNGYCPPRDPSDPQDHQQIRHPDLADAAHMAWAVLEVAEVLIEIAEQRIHFEGEQ